jgi:hypothetical protein
VLGSSCSLRDRLRGCDVALQPGYTFINGHHPDTARELLAAAEALGLDPGHAVRTDSHGYIVPDAVADALTAPAPNEAF